MRARPFTLGLLAVLLSHCKAEPDFVATTTPPSCDLRSQLVRRGYPENLDQILVPGNCTATRTPGMRGPDFSFWLAGAQTPWADCTSTQFEPMFWTESGPDGKITRVHFCPEFCEELREQLFEELEKDVACPQDAGMPEDTGPPSGPNFPIPTAGTIGSGGTGTGTAGLPALTAGGGGAAGTPVAGAGGVGGGAAGASAGAGGLTTAGASGVAAGAGGVAAAGAGGVAAGTGGVAAAGGGGVAAGAGASNAQGGLPIAGSSSSN